MNSHSYPYFTCNVAQVSFKQYPQPWQAECQQRQRNSYTSGWDDFKIGNYFMKSNPALKTALASTTGWILFIACFLTFAQVTQDWPLKSLPFTMPTMVVGQTDVVYLDRCLHATPFTSWHILIMYIGVHWGIISVLLLCHGHLIKSNRNLGLTLFCECLQIKLIMMHGDGAFLKKKNCTASLVWLTNNISTVTEMTNMFWTVQPLLSSKPC